MPLNKAEQEDTKVTLLPEHPHLPRSPIIRHCQRTTIPSFICDNYPKVFNLIYIRIKIIDNIIKTI